MIARSTCEIIFSFNYIGRLSFNFVRSFFNLLRCSELSYKPILDKKFSDKSLSKKHENVWSKKAC